MIMKIIVLTIVVAVVFVFPSVNLFSQEVSQELPEEKIKRAVEGAIRSLQAEKDKADAQLAQNLKSGLYEAIYAWISDAKASKANDLNKLLHESWSALEIKEITFPVPNDYYLKSYEYLIRKADCDKTDSVVSPYKAYAEIIEKCRIESYHPSNVSDVRQYYYTTTRLITVSFEYEAGYFKVSGAEYGPMTFKRGW